MAYEPTCSSPSPSSDIFFGLENAGNQSNGGRANDLIINHTCKFKNKTIDVMSEELQTIDSDTGIVFSAFREAISDVPPSEAQLSLDTYYSLSDYTASDDTQVSWLCVVSVRDIIIYIFVYRTYCLFSKNRVIVLLLNRLSISYCLDVFPLFLSSARLATRREGCRSRKGEQHVVVGGS